MILDFNNVQEHSKRAGRSVQRNSKTGAFRPVKAKDSHACDAPILLEHALVCEVSAEVQIQLGHQVRVLI